VLRNNRTSEEYPLGIFHPHPEWHHIKKENIGLIEVMGLAVLPGRLRDEIDSNKITRGEIGEVFTNVLRDCGVFKDNEAGREQFYQLIRRSFLSTPLNFS
jgi:UDPglucose--hexose-1-phosphate uridylyltransferase